MNTAMLASLKHLTPAGTELLVYSEGQSDIVFSLPFCLSDSFRRDGHYLECEILEWYGISKQTANSKGYMYGYHHPCMTPVGNQ